MAALKTYFRKLAERLGESSVQYNQWLQAMVSAKVLLPRPGLGPGSGVELTSKSLATFLLANLASDHRAEAIALVGKLIEYKPAWKKKRVCPFTGESNLRDIIAAAFDRELSSAGKPVFLWQIELHRGSDNVVVLHWRVGSKPYEINHWPADLLSPFALKLPAKSVQVSLHVKTLGEIASDLRAMVPGKKTSGAS